MEGNQPEEIKVIFKIKEGQAELAPLVLFAWLGS